MPAQLTPVQIHPEYLKPLRAVKDTTVLAWVVMQISSKNKRQKRLVLISTGFLFIVMPDGDIRRVIKLQDLATVKAKQLNPLDTTDKTPCSSEVCITTKDPSEPVILFRVRDDRRNRPEGSNIQQFEDILKASVAQSKGDCEFSQIGNGQPLCSSEDLRKRTDYVTPLEKKKRWASNDEINQTINACREPSPPTSPSPLGTGEQQAVPNFGSPAESLVQGQQVQEAQSPVYSSPPPKEAVLLPPPPPPPKEETSPPSFHSPLGPSYSPPGPSYSPPSFRSPERAYPKHKANGNTAITITVGVV